MNQRVPWLEIEQIIGRLPLAVDRVMGEGGLYDERTAARAFRRAEGDPVAAADMVQALRAALPRFDAAQVVERRGTGDDWHDDGERQSAASSGRSARLEAMAQAETGGLVHLARQLVADGDAGRRDRMLGEVHHDELPVVVAHPITGEAVTIGHLRVSEAEVLDDGVTDAGEGPPQVKAGYGICLGHNDRKAIAAAQMDVAQIDVGGGVSAPALLERLRRPDDCGVDSAAALGG